MDATASLISVDEYLNSSYAPDAEFVDGVIVERNTGELPHADLHGIVTVFFGQHSRSHGIKVFPATSLRVTPGRICRVPDVLVVEKPYTKGRIVEDVPAIVIEVTSPRDLFDDIFDKCHEYEKLGVVNNIVMDPDLKRGWFFRKGGLQVFKGNSVELLLPRQQRTLDFPFAQMFAELDED